MGNMIEVPTETCGDGANGRTLDENLAILASKHKHFLLGVQGRIKHELEPIGNVCTTDTTDESHYGIGVIYDLYSFVYECYGMALFVYHDAPCIAWDFGGSEQLGIKVVVEFRANSNILTIICNCEFLTFRRIYSKGVFYLFSLLVPEINAECLGIHGSVLCNKGERECTAEVYTIGESYFKPIILGSRCPSAVAICAINSIKHIAEVGDVVTCEIVGSQCYCITIGIVEHK